MKNIKRIYFRSVEGYYETLLVGDDNYSIGTELYEITDLIGRRFLLPIKMTAMKIENWDGNIEYAPREYTNALLELKGEVTGVVTKNKK